MNEEANVEKALYLLQFSERIKSELIIASRLMQAFSDMHEDEVKGASKLLTSFLNALMGEVGIAHSVTRDDRFKEVRDLLFGILSYLDPRFVRENLDRISRALSKVATCASEATDVLVKCGVLSTEECLKG